MLSVQEKERLREIWEDLPPSLPKVYEEYPKKRAKLAKAVYYIDDKIKKGIWPYWVSWSKWDSERLPITYCFECQWPVRLKPTVNQSTGELKKLECAICGLIHFDSRYD